MSPPHDPLVVAQAERRLLNAERLLDDIFEHDVADLDQAMDELYAAERSLAKARGEQHVGGYRPYSSRVPRGR